MTQDILFQSIGGVQQLNLFLQLAIIAPIVFAAVFNRILAGEKPFSLKTVTSLCVVWSVVFLLWFIFDTGLSLTYFVPAFLILWGIAAVCCLANYGLRTAILHFRH